MDRPSWLPPYRWKYLLLAWFFNGVAVFIINQNEGGVAGASMAALVQFGVSTLAGYSVPFCQKHVFDRPIAKAYFYGSLTMALVIASAGALAHFIFQTPDYWSTVAWNFWLNLVGGFVLVSCKRSNAFVTRRLRHSVGLKVAMTYYRFWKRL